jgi:hypothetical protein
MPAELNWKNKYLELRSKYINDIDMAFRLGYEQGMQGAQQQQAQEQKTQMEQAQQLQAQGLNGDNGEGKAPRLGDEGGEIEQPGQSPGTEQSSELDQHIGKLETMLSSTPDAEIKKSLQALVTLRKAEKEAMELKKSAAAIPGIIKALHKPSFKLGVTAAHNLTENSKKTITLQHKIVNDIFKSWQTEEAKASKDIIATIQAEALLKE